MLKEKQEGRTGENTWFLEKSKYSHLTGMQGSNGGAETWELRPDLEDALRQLSRDTLLSSQESKAEYLHTPLLIWAFLMTLMVKNLPAMQETWLLSLGQEDPLEKGMDTHSSVLA